MTDRGLALNEIAVMHLSELQTYFDTSPAVRLLRSPNAPFVVDFLWRQFKQPGAITLQQSDLLSGLKQYQEEVHEEWPDFLKEPADSYLNIWCADDTRWLHRYLDSAHEEPVYELTPHTEDVVTFLDRVLRQNLGFIGTESRLKIVIGTLSDLVVGASENREQHLQHLQSEKRRIEAEIARLESGDEVQAYRPAQVRERFSTAVSMLKELQSDFRAVEQRFKTIIRSVQQRQQQFPDTRGGILEFALDSEELLKEEDQGVSFYEFVRFILSPTEQQRLGKVVDQLSQLDDIGHMDDDLETVHHMVPTLLAEAEKVMRTNRRLSTTLRRLLETRANQERKRVAQLLGEIRVLASSVSDEPPTDIGLNLETKLDIASPFQRTFWVEPPEFEQVDLTEFVSDTSSRTEAFREFATLNRLDWKQMRERIALSMLKSDMPTLGQVLEDNPPEAGVVEVLGYLQIAHDDGHMISVGATEEIVLPCRSGTNRRISVTVPLVRFAVP